MITRFVLGLLMVISCVASLSAQQAQYGNNGPALLPDLQVTPGKVAITDKETICTTKWGKDERHVTPAMKKQAYSEYGTAPGKGVCNLKSHTSAKGKLVTEGCEVDHLVSRELGGADAIENLWPQPYTQHPGAHEKDWLENELHKEVCNKKGATITLEEAQQEITADWYAAYLKRKRPK